MLFVMINYACDIYTLLSGSLTSLTGITGSLIWKSGLLKVKCQPRKMWNMEHMRSIWKTPYICDAPFMGWLLLTFT